MINLKADPDDHLKNRRMMAFIAFCFILIWPVILLLAYLFLDMELSAVGVFLGYAGTFGGSPIVAYFLAANKEN